MTIYSSWRAVEFPKRRSNLKIWNTAQCVQVQENFQTNTREIVLEHFGLFGMSCRLSRLTWTNFLLRIPFSRIHHGGKNAHRGNMSQNAIRWTVRAHTIEGRLGVTKFCSSFCLSVTLLVLFISQDFYPFLKFYVILFYCITKNCSITKRIFYSEIIKLARNSNLYKRI